MVCVTRGSDSPGAAGTGLLVAVVGHRSLCSQSWCAAMPEVSLPDPAEHPCGRAPLGPSTPGAEHPYGRAPLEPSIPAAEHPCGQAPLGPSTPAAKHPCGRAALGPSIPTAEHRWG